MSDPSAALQLARDAALRTAASVVAQFPNGRTRLYSLSAPVGAPFPHLITGDDQVIGDSAACVGGSEITSTIHVKAREGTLAASLLKAKALAGAVRAALDAELPLSGHRMVDWSFETTRHMSEPDLLTAHSVVTVNYYTEPTA